MLPSEPTDWPPKPRCAALPLPSPHNPAASAVDTRPNSSNRPVADHVEVALHISDLSLRTQQGSLTTLLAVYGRFIMHRMVVVPTRAYSKQAHFPRCTAREFLPILDHPGAHQNCTGDMGMPIFEVFTRSPLSTTQHPDRSCSIPMGSPAARSRHHCGASILVLVLASACFLGAAEQPSWGWNGNGPPPRGSGKQPQPTDAGDIW